MLSFPFNSSTTVFYINKDAFKAAGIDTAKPPATWPEVALAAAKLKASGHKCPLTIAWQGWTLHVSLDPLEGIVLRDVAYLGRPILRRASISEMVVPYGDPGPGHGWKNAFDVGEWGRIFRAEQLVQIHESSLRQPDGAPAPPKVQSMLRLRRAV